MSKIEEAKQILEAIGLPKRQQNDRSALTLLALCNLKEKDKWSKEIKYFKENVGLLRDKYLKKRELRKIPIKLKDGTELTFSPGKHNEVQIAVIEEFAPRFAPGSDLLYVGDTAKKDL